MQTQALLSHPDAVTCFDLAGVLDGVEQARASKQAKRVDEVWAALRRSAGAAASTSGALSISP